jgi:hypothetical protein
VSDFVRNLDGDRKRGVYHINMNHVAEIDGNNRCFTAKGEYVGKAATVPGRVVPCTTGAIVITFGVDDEDGSVWHDRHAVHAWKTDGEEVEPLIVAGSALKGCFWCIEEHDGAGKILRYTFPYLQDCNTFEEALAFVKESHEESQKHKKAREEEKPA